MSATTTLGHVENSLETAQGFLNQTQKVVAELEAVHERTARLASVLRQAAIGLAVGGVLLGVLAIRNHHGD
jgi:hypothetical protein